MNGKDDKSVRTENKRRALNYGYYVAELRNESGAHPGVDLRKLAPNREKQNQCWETPYSFNSLPFLLPEIFKLRPDSAIACFPTL